jgi:hypothetical protein
MIDGNGRLIPLESALAQERSHFLSLTRKFSLVEDPKTLQEICEALRAALATESPVRYAWANVGPELLWALWGAMEKMGGTIPERPDVLKLKPSIKEGYLQEVLGAIGQVVKWCEEKQSPINSTVLPSGKSHDFVSASALAAQLGISNRMTAVESFLRRYREKYPDCYVCLGDDDRRRNDPKYLYRSAEVLRALKEHFGIE